MPDISLFEDISNCWPDPAIRITGGYPYGVICRLIPTKGMTLPFISYGGSSLMTSGLTIGLLIALTRHRQYRDAPPQANYTQTKHGPMAKPVIMLTAGGTGGHIFSLAVGEYLIDQGWTPYLLPTNVVGI